MNKQELVAELRNLVSNTEGEFTPEAADKAMELRNAIEATESATTETEVVEEAAAETEVEQIEETRAAAPTVQIQNKMNNYNFSLGKAVKEAAEGQVTGFEAEVIAESRNAAAANGIQSVGSVVFDPAVLAEMRDGNFQADAGAASGDNASALVGLDVSAPVYTLRPRSIFDRLGVQRLTGLRGDLVLPVGAGATAVTRTEIQELLSDGSDITEKTLTPQRIASMMTVSGQLMKQSEANVEAFLMGDLMRAMGEAQDRYLMDQLTAGQVFGNGSSFTDVADILAEMEAALDTAGANRDGAEFLVHPDAFKFFRTAPMVAGVNAIADSKSVIGYNTVISSQVTDRDIDGADADTAQGPLAILGDFSDFVIGEWGGIDITVDPYSKAHFNQVRLVVNSHIDGTYRQAANFKGYHSIGA